jgi:hypothetical protein
MTPGSEVADIFRRRGEAFRQTHACHLGYVEQRINGAITACRTAALGGHIEQCDAAASVTMTILYATARGQDFNWDQQN